MLVPGSFYKHFANFSSYTHFLVFIIPWLLLYCNGFRIPREILTQRRRQSRQRILAVMDTFGSFNSDSDSIGLGPSNLEFHPTNLAISNSDATLKRILGNSNFNLIDIKFSPPLLIRQNIV